MKGGTKVNLRELMAKRQNLLEQAKRIADTVEQEKRAMTEEEIREYDGLVKQVDEIDGTIARLKGLSDRMGKEQERFVKDAFLDMPEKDVKQYSLLRAIRAAAKNDWSLAPLEKEASDAVQKKLRKEPQGFFVPEDILQAPMEQRTVDTTAAAGAIANDFRGASFIEMLHNRMVLRAAGARVLAGLTGPLDIPKQTGGSTAYWVGEATDVGESNVTIGQLELTPKTVGTFTELTRRALIQSSLDMERLLREDMATSIALAVDYAGFHGGGGDAPTGIAGTTGVSVVEVGDNGGPLTWDHIVALETAIASANADVANMAYITNALVRGKLKTTPKEDGYPQYIWENGPTPLNGYRAFVTNQVRHDLTKGTGTNLSALFFGNWGDLIIGQWTGLDVIVNPYAKDKQGTTRIVMLMDINFAVRHPESFSVCLDAQTS